MLQLFLAAQEMWAVAIRIESAKALAYTASCINSLNRTIALLRLLKLADKSRGDLQFDTVDRGRYHQDTINKMKRAARMSSTSRKGYLVAASDLIV